MTFGTGSTLKKPQGLQIQIDENEDDGTEEHSKDSKASVNSRTYQAGSGMRKIERTTTPRSGNMTPSRAA